MENKRESKKEEGGVMKRQTEGMQGREGEGGRQSNREKENVK